MKHIFISTLFVLSLSSFAAESNPAHFFQARREELKCTLLPRLADILRNNNQQKNGEFKKLCAKLDYNDFYALQEASCERKNGALIVAAQLNRICVTGSADANDYKKNAENFLTAEVQLFDQLNILLREEQASNWQIEWSRDYDSYGKYRLSYIPKRRTIEQEVGSIE